MTNTDQSKQFNVPDEDFEDAPADIAARYRGCGWQVVPAWMPDEHKQWKRPYLKKWQQYQKALVSDEVFASFYGPTGAYIRRPNMGLLTGECSDWTIVIDLDTQKTPAALAWWQRVLALHNNSMEPETVEQVTGGGGRQLFFRAPGIKVATCKTAIGVDIRADGGFAMLPSSVHESGARYAWKAGRAPWEHEILVAAPWLLEELKKLTSEHPAAGAKPSGNGHAGNASGTGESQFDAFGAQRDMREQLMTEMVWRAVLEWHRECPIPPPESQWEPRSADAYAAYEVLVAVKRTAAKLSKREQLDVEGRGPKEWRRKWWAAMAKWGTPEFQAEARKPPPDADDDDFGPAARASEPPPQAAQAIEQIPLIDAFPIVEAHLPVRNWAVPGLMLKGTLSVLVAPPGSGKSLLSLQLAIAIAVGISWGGWSPRKQEKVLIINAEDDIDEMRRRLCAAARIMGVEQERLIGRVFLAKAPESVVIAKFDSKHRVIVRTPLIEQLVATIKEQGIGVCIADPFAETFEGDENSNSEVKWGAILWREVARRTAAGLLLVHHTRKYANGMAGEADASRGGGALIGVARILVTLFGMTEEEAQSLNVAADKRLDYLRVDDAKANYSKLDRARWFRKQTVKLANATAFLDGDEVGVLAPWQPPDTLNGVPLDQLNEVLELIDAGVPARDGVVPGQLYSASVSAADRWAGRLLMDRFGCSEQQAKKLIKTWLQNDVLREVDYTDPVVRKPRKGLRAPQQNRPGTKQVFD